MKKKIAILGSTGSIGNTLIRIIKKNKNKFKVLLLSADKDYKNLFKQANIFNVKHLIITNKIIIKPRILKNLKTNGKIYQRSGLHEYN